MFEKIKALFGSHFETKDQHYINELRTKYFKTTKDRLYKGCFNIIEKDSNLQLLAESIERGEISARFASGKKGICVLTIVSVAPFQTAVDISITIDKGYNFGFAQKVVQSFYQKLGQEFQILERN